MDMTTKKQYVKFWNFVSDLSDDDKAYYVMTDCINFLNSFNQIERQYIIDELKKLDEERKRNGE